MNIYTSLDDIKSIKNPVLTIGTYDGVHLGHQKIITYLNEEAKRVKGESVVFTFHPHPRMVLHPDDHQLELIQTIDERIEKLEAAGVDHLIVFPFSYEFSRLSSVEFVRDILVNQIGLHTLVVGYDHHFGRNREGSMAQLEELAPLYEFEVKEISAFMQDEVKISSTKIRNALKSGEVDVAAQFLGAYFELSGEVIHGDKIGTQLNYPTANVKIKEDYKLIPADGVYAVKVIVGEGEFSGMLNIGNRPTLGDGLEKRIEVNLFDFNQDIYGERITLKLIKYIREDKTFENLEALKKEIEKDESKCRLVLGDYQSFPKKF